MAACAQGLAGQGGMSSAGIRVGDEPFTGAHQIVVCRQCYPDAQCAAACPAEAINWDGQYGVWRIDRVACSRCGACVTACPFGAMFWRDDEFGPLKCELCDGVPRCVAACHFGVIQYGAAGDPELSRQGIPAEDLDPMLGRGA